jgi:hypothetical protein
MEDFKNITFNFLMTQVLDLKSTMGPDDYPTEETERLIRDFQVIGGFERELMSAIKEVWAFGSWGWREEDVEEDGEKYHRYDISTGGWSGNEALILALEANLFWLFYWVQSNRGGHYVFEVPIKESI